MLRLKSQIEISPAIMGAVLRLPFDQKFSIRKQVQTVCLYIDAASPSRCRSVLPLPGRIDGRTCESSSSRLRTFFASAFVPASNRGILFMCRAIIFLVVVCFHSSVGIALDPTRHISQYGHSVWRVQDGYFGGMPSAVAQTADGYIWIGTDAGLFKFDGMHFVRWNAQSGEALPSSSISSLLGAQDGSLWIGTDAGLAQVVHNRMILYEKGWGIGHTIIEDKGGRIWFSRYRADDRKRPLCQVAGNDVNCYGSDDGINVSGTGAIAQDDSGDLWIGSEKTLVRWRVGVLSKVYRPQALRFNPGYAGVESITRAADRSLWVGIEVPGRGGGLQHLVNGILKPFRVPEVDGETLGVSSLYSDDQENLWVGTYHGLYKIHGENVDHYGTAEGLSDDVVYDIFEDRERNVWVATSQGVDMFRDLRVTSISAREGLSEDAVESVAADRDGRVWVGTSSVQVLDPNSLSLETMRTLKGNQITSLFVDDSGHLWAGMDNRLFVREQGRFREITKLDGSPLGMIMGIAEDWIVTFGLRLLRLGSHQAHSFGFGA